MSSNDERRLAAAESFCCKLGASFAGATSPIESLVNFDGLFFFCLIFDEVQVLKIEFKFYVRTLKVFTCLFSIVKRFGRYRCEQAKAYNANSVHTIPIFIILSEIFILINTKQ